MANFDYRYGSTGFPLSPWRPNPYDVRPDGSLKGLGYYGPLLRPDGGVMTELSIGTTINGKQMDVPSFVPGLSAEQIATLLRIKDGEKLPKSIAKLAVAHARERISRGLSPFAQQGEPYLSPIGGLLGAAVK